MTGEGLTKEKTRKTSHNNNPYHLMNSYYGPNAILGFNTTSHFSHTPLQVISCIGYLIFYPPPFFSLRELPSCSASSMWPCDMSPFPGQVVNRDFSKPVAVGSSNWQSISSDSAVAVEIRWEVCCRASRKGLLTHLPRHKARCFLCCLWALSSAHDT